MLGLAVLLTGLVAGYALGYRQVGRAVLPSPITGTGAAVPARPGPAGTSSGPAGFPAGAGAYSSRLTVGLSGAQDLAQAGPECSAQHGHQLQVGVAVINLSESTLTLGPIKPVLPIGGMRPIAEQWVPCGTIPSSWPGSGPGSDTFIWVSTSTGSTGYPNLLPGGDTVPPGGTAWLSVAFQVLVPCPRALPVQFTVSYSESGRPQTTRLTGFPDLGEVPYSGCTGGSSLRVSGTGHGCLSRLVEVDQANLGDPLRVPGI
jgi:hypothetical protein